MGNSRRTRTGILAFVGVAWLCLAALPGCVTVPPEVQRELEPPEPGQPNNFPLRKNTTNVTTR